ncbi:MAG: type II secretion system F family protein [Bacillota bacterium]
MYLVSALVFMAAFSIFMAFSLSLSGKSIEMNRRVVEVVGQRNSGIRDKELSEPITRRLFKPLLNSMIKLSSRMLPSEKEAEINRRLIKAGRPGGHSPREFIAVKLVLAVTGPGILILAQPLIGLDSTDWLLLVLAASIGGWLLPDLYLKKKITERKNEVEKSLPDVLDLITVSVEAGTGFDGALLKVVEKGKNVLSSEFLVVLQECKMGKSRKEALRDMANRVDVDDLSTFVGSIIMAEQLGIGIGNVMRLQSDQMRRKRRQRAEEQAMKAPVKMMIPMVTCIFPTIFVVLLGPAAISLYKNFVV